MVRQVAPATLDVALVADVAPSAILVLMDVALRGEVRAAESIRLWVAAGDLLEGTGECSSSVSLSWPPSLRSRPSAPLGRACCTREVFARLAGR